MRKKRYKHYSLRALRVWGLGLDLIISTAENNHSASLSSQ